MNTDTAITDDIGAAHVALLLAREPVARAIVERHTDEPPAYTQPALNSLYLAASALVGDGQVPDRDGILRTLQFWIQEKVPDAEHAAEALELIEQLPTDEPLALDEAHAAARAEQYEQQMDARAKPRPMFPLISLSELSARPAPDWLIDNVLVCGKTSLLTAKHASFKSFFSLDMGLCVATGTPWHTHPVKPGSVVYVAAEGASGLVKRVRAWCIENAADLPDNFHIVEKPTQIQDKGLRRQFEQAVAVVDPVLIVLDTLARCAVGLDENSAKDMGEFADALGLLAEETGAHVMTVHHNNKSGEYRGSSSVPAAVDTHLSMERDARGETVSLKCEKQKDAEEFGPYEFSKAIIDWDGNQNSLVFRREQNGYSRWGGLSTAEEKYLRELIGAFGPAGASNSKWREVCEGAGGFAARTYQRAVRKLRDDGYVTCPDPGKRGAIYKPDMEKCAKVLGDTE